MIGADEVFEIINDALFKMTWLNQLIGTGLMGMGVDTTSQVGASVLFFCYDTVKIAILLVAVIFIIGYIQSYFPPERTKKLLGHLHGIWANIVGALMGPSRHSAPARRFPCSLASPRPACPSV